MRLVQSIKNIFSKENNSTISKTYERHVYQEFPNLYRSIVVGVVENATENVNSIKAQSYLTANRELFEEIDSNYTAEIIVRDLGKIVNFVEVQDYEKSRKVLRINVKRA